MGPLHGKPRFVTAQLKSVISDSLPLRDVPLDHETDLTGWNQFKNSNIELMNLNLLNATERKLQ